MIIRTLASVLFVWLATAFCYAGPVMLDERQPVIELGTVTEFFLDHSGELDLQAVREQGQFQPGTTPALNLGFTQARVWLRFTLSNPGNFYQQRVLDIRQFLLDNVTLYEPDGAGGYLVTPNGRQHLGARPQPSGRHFSFLLDIPPYSTLTYYLAVESADSIALPLVLSTPAEQHRHELRDTVFMTLYAGVVLSTLSFAIFMLVSLRERMLFYYTVFLLTHNLIAIMSMEGILTAVFGLTSLPLTRELNAMSISFSIVVVLLFMREFLRLKQSNPTLYRATHWLVGLVFLAFIGSLVLPHLISIMVVSSFCMVAGTGILICCLRQFRQQREARHFLMAWAPGIVGATIYGLRVYELAPVNVVTGYAWLVGTAVEAILFSYTIAQRINTERRERLRTQTELADRERALRLTQEQLLQAETAAKEELEHRVRERTRDIMRILAELELENRSLLELSINDALTRVRNRRFFNDFYPQAWQDALEGGHWLSLIMLDVDHFKTVNDSHGHLGGDRCLVAVANVLRQIVSRPSDMICRYGGEEFILVLAETDPDAARWVAERIRIKISETVIELDDGPLQVTASLGVTGIIPVPGLDPLKLVARADEALYQSKQQGRNRTTLLQMPQASNLVPLNRHA